MSVTFIRIDDRIIHGQITTRWIREYSCDGIIVVNDKIAQDPILKQVYKRACDKKVFIWTMEEWEGKKQKVLESASNYFLITKDAMDMERILVTTGFEPGLRQIFFGPSTMRPNTKPVAGSKFYLSDEEAKSLESLYAAGYETIFAMVKEETIGKWNNYRSIFGYVD